MISPGYRQNGGVIDGVDLRRQMVRPYRKPLIIFTPKSLLRHKESVSSLEDLANGEYQVVIPDPEMLDPKKVKRVVFCSGKIYFELAAARRASGQKDTAIVRIEQLYPFPHEMYKAELDRYSKAKEIVWCQEEPANQGAWHRIQHYLLRHLSTTHQLFHALRPSSASTAGGYMQAHIETQKALLDAALTMGVSSA